MVEAIIFRSCSTCAWTSFTVAPTRCKYTHVKHSNARRHRTSTHVWCPRLQSPSSRAWRGPILRVVQRRQDGRRSEVCHHRYAVYMFGRRQVVQNEVVAQHMRRFFRFSRLQHMLPDDVAKTYGRKLWSRREAGVVDEQKFMSERFTVALATDESGTNFEAITKRVTLVSDTLVLSHTNSENFHFLGMQENYTKSAASPRQRAESNLMGAVDLATQPGAFRHDIEALPTLSDMMSLNQKWYGMYCPDLTQLGKWILGAEPLLRAGLVWYLPCYATGLASGEARWNGPLGTGHLKSHQPYPGIDYLIKGRRAVDASGANPVKSRLVRPVLTVDLPFVDGVSLRDFSDITTQEFDSYVAFRDFLRLTFNEMDDAMDDVQSERELVKHGLQIKQEVRAVQSEMMKVKRKRAMAASGAAVGTVGAILVAVYGPAMQAAIATVGAGGSLWGIIHAATENSIKTLRDDKWYYVWVLARKHNPRII
jgi:hypothetical protein